MDICLRDATVLTVTRYCITMARSMVSFLFSQSTSCHRSANSSLTLSPNDTESRAIVLNGSASSAISLRNSSTVRLRGCRVRFVAPLTTTNSIGLRESVRDLTLRCRAPSATNLGELPDHKRPFVSNHAAAKRLSRIVTYVLSRGSRQSCMPIKR